MHKLTLRVVCCLTVLLSSCQGRLEEHVTELERAESDVVHELERGQLPI
jgi:hypothetical protein